ncbi:MAG: Fic family protein [Chloroflexi bacterium]|nr:Fic family protein [Chloroflexota bacterium]
MNPKDFQKSEVGKVIRAKNGYWTFLPAQLPPKLDWTPRLVDALSEAEHELGRLTTLAVNKPLARLLTHPFLRREAVLSSRIEGTRASLVDLYLHESSQIPSLETSRDVFEVHNYVRALEDGLSRLKVLPVSLRLMREIHAKLFENIRMGHLTPGNFRSTQNWIGPAGCTLDDATYVPPPVDEMQPALNSLETFIHTDTTELPALVRAGMIHYQFEIIHPFLDGNGRVGRLLLILLLHEWELLSHPLLNLSVYFEHFRQEYYGRLLAVTQRGHCEDWLLFFLKGISTQAQDGITRLARLEGIREKYAVILTLRADRNPARMSVVIDFLFSRPIFTNRQLADGLNIPYKTAGEYIDRLIHSGILNETTGHANNRIFQANEILKAVEGK